MLEFERINVNPKKRKTGDCSTRALVGALNIEYEEALELQCEVAKETCYGITDKEVIEGVCKKFGYIKMKQPRKWNNKKYMVKELDEILTPEQLQDGVLVTIANHHTCIKNGVIQDIWNCGNKAVGNYYINGYGKGKNEI